MVGEPRGSFHLDWGLSLVKWRTIPNVHMHIVTFSLLTMSEKQEEALHINPLEVNKGSRLYRSNVGHGMISWSDQSGVKHTQTPHYLKQSQCRALSWSLIIKKIVNTYQKSSTWSSLIDRSDQWAKVLEITARRHLATANLSSLLTETAEQWWFCKKSPTSHKVGQVGEMISH